GQSEENSKFGANSLEAGCHLERTLPNQMFPQLHSATLLSASSLVTPGKLWPTIQDRLPASDILQTADRQLQPFLSCLDLALRSQKAVIALQMWQHSYYLSLLPFHLHLRWTNEIEGLPMTVRIGLAPFLKSDEALVNSRLYRVGDAILAREKARRT